MLKPRLSAFFSLFFVFLSGILVGTLGYRYYSVNYTDKGAPPRRPDPVEVKRRIIAEMTDAVKLDSGQVEQLGKILDETRVRFKDVHDELDKKGHEIWQDQIDQINQILTPEQRSLYKALRDKHEKDREERKKKRDHDRGITQDTSKK
ncbi:MAG TPA: hypothetical protein VML19_10765 [Verrucomicrobiae bacterium]|nr:hypothetical protein [Verrucomicrobiae bacterium]